MDVRERFDIVLAMEVVEHVTDVGMFLNRCAAMLKPGGMMVISTLNRNWKSFALAIVGAEYVLRWLPRGTHQWDKFVTPDELAHHLAEQQARHHRTGRRGLQPVRRPLEPLVRHGRELHGGGGGAVTLVSDRPRINRPPPIRANGDLAPARQRSLRQAAAAFSQFSHRCHDAVPVDRIGRARHGGRHSRRSTDFPTCSASPRSGFPSPSSRRSGRSRAMRCSGS